MLQLAEENSIIENRILACSKEEFPSINQKSIMVGDSISDMEFAKNANMFAVLIGQSESIFVQIR